MSEVAGRYGRVAEGFEMRLRAVGEEQLGDATPCTDWDVRALVSHVVDVHARVLSMLGGADPDPVDAQGDLLGQWIAARSAIAEALADPERSAQTVGSPFGEQPFESLVGRLLCADTLLHTWDLARATGQDDALDPEAAARALEFLEPLDEGIRRPGGFGPKIESPPGADVQARLIAFGGRRPA